MFEEFEILCRDKEEWMKRNGYTTSIDSVNNAVFNDAFNHLRYKPKGKDHFELSRYYQSKRCDENRPENGICLSQSAIVFLLSSFLSKKEGEEFRSRIKGFKAKVIKTERNEITRENNSLRFMATHWVYSWGAFKGYKKMLNTDYPRETLLVQIIDELSKVPESVYEVLNKEKRKEFLEDINEFVLDHNETNYRSTIIHPVIRKRYEDKFNYFVIRYLDEFVEFPSLRFQVHLGNYVHDRRDKVLPGNIGVTSRIIKEKINVFGKLSILSKSKVEKLVPDKDKTGWERFPNPSYNFVGNNVPIFLSCKTLLEKIKEYHAKRDQIEQRTERIKGKITVSRMIFELSLKKKCVFHEPVAMLSLNEIPSLLFFLLSLCNTPRDAEQILIDKLLKKLSLLESFSNVKEKEKNEYKHIPKTLRKATKLEHINQSKLLNAITEEIEQTQKRCEILSSSQNNKGECHLKKKERGEMATWMARDLIRLMPMPNRSTWKGYCHRQLQAALAFYHKHERREAVDLLCSVWDFKNDKNFAYSLDLQQMFDKASSFEELLNFYLIIRSKMLEAMKNSVLTNSNKLFNKAIKQQRIWTFFNRRLYVIDGFDNLKSKILAKPLVFDRGIFDERPTFIPNLQYKEDPEKFAEWYRYAQDYADYQAFYEYERDYSELYKLEKNDVDLTDKDKFNIRLKRDRMIKQNQIQDVYLMLIVKDLACKIFKVKEEDFNISLSDIFVSRSERLNQQKNAISQSIRKKGDSSDNIIKESFIWSKTFLYEQGQICEPQIKLKDFGKFRQLLEDNKVKTIFSYNPNKKWSKKEIEEELIQYEIIRREYIFKEIHNFEAYILKHGVVGDEPNFRRYVIDLLKKTPDPVLESGQKLLRSFDFEANDISELSSQRPLIQKVFFVILIRNKFAHNELIHLNYWK
ncbi:type VI-B CRISPR-associated RNA-guided ribonuclease Cas13b [Falsiporphyromonas endometrii]|uniref:Type VI-B CRISPR-associated RNA-guided ribonuclease Cas13b n=1 Tax=Falsiporphyromonas endometrii TaxID=1387297 RepID=A0ABV9K8W2_9PORP